ncbi:hypothetical protein JJV70_09410 [Streptomyces sp. JJ66]|uniref:AMIN-like domain-containing (lipo)protein n=1 Tax=Streptomyces sp. JJ66 TaxID=2803843 RepID=UPI001C59873F|nr:hypothetical protein [Streptomyces sp. JJ66]MBW1602324.1 hypothetical protein [Streptomyces sp. JJ66]
MRRRPPAPALPLAALALATALTLTACGSEPASEAGSVSTSPSAPASEPGPQTHSPTAPPASPSVPASPTTEFSAQKVSGEGDNFTTRPTLRNVMLTEHDGYDRLTFTFEGGTPGYIAHYMDPLAHGGRGDVTEVPGEHGLKLVLVGMPREANVPFDGEPTDTVRGVAGMGVFEGELGVAIGVESQDGFRVTPAAGTLTVDIAH